MIDSENRFVLSDKRSIIILNDADDHIDNVVQNARGKCPKDSYESGTFKCNPSLSDAAKSDEQKEFKELTSEYFSELGGFHVTKYQGMKEFIIRGHNKEVNNVVLDAINKLSKEDQSKIPDFTVMRIKDKSKYFSKLHTLGLQEGLNSDEIKQEIEKHLKPKEQVSSDSVKIKKIPGVKPSWQGIAKEALKYDDFEKYSTAWVADNMFGKYWHITDDPDFKIDPEKGPRDMSSMGSGKGEKGKLMVSSVPEHWVDQYPNRKYIAEIDLSDVPKDKYSSVRRGFGQEIMIEDPSKARVTKVYPIKDGLRAFNRYFDNLPQSEEELRGIWEKAHQAIKQNSEYVEPIEIRLNYKCPKGTKDPNTNECMDGHSGTTVNEEKYSFSRGSDGKLQYALNPKLSKEEKKVYKLEADINKYIRDNEVDLDEALGLRGMTMLVRSLGVSRDIEIKRDFKINKTPTPEKPGSFYHTTPEEERIHLISSVAENPELLKTRDPLLFNSVIRAAKSGKLGKEVKKHIGNIEQVDIKDDKPAFERKHVNDEWKARRKEDFKAYTTEKEYVDTLGSDNVDTNDKKYDSGLVISDKIKKMNRVSEFYYDMIDRFGADDMTDNRLSLENKQKMVSVLERVNEVIPNFPVSKIQIGDTSGFGGGDKKFLALTLNSINTVVFEERYFDFGNSKELISTLTESIDNKNHPPGSANFESVFIHELGHVLENTLETSDSDEVLDIHSKFIDSYDKKHAVSRYALANDNEFFAETFLCAVLPNDATKDNVNVINMRNFLSKISKKNGGKLL